MALDFTTAQVARYRYENIASNLPLVSEIKSPEGRRSSEVIYGRDPCVQMRPMALRMTSAIPGIEEEKRYDVDWRAKELAQRIRGR